jgi:tRNA/tmRNA/rRNA uracil-C5-methylase (TrmA/RlmC/RlmD family)
MVYVACDPVALARDLRRLGEHGYRLAALHALDAFPMTHHLETVALVVR